MKVSVIITTYNSEVWLEKVLWGYTIQTESDFEVVIADDGSTQKTKEVIDSFRKFFKHNIIHVWHADQGFRKPEIVNKAILQANSEYLLFTDGDCIPRKDFIETHIKHKEEGYFLSGGYFKLPIHISNTIDKENIINNKCFTYNWLFKNNLPKTFKILKLTKSKIVAAFMNWVTTTKKTFNGHNTSVFKKDILEVNGFNEEMHYGGLDREIGERLFNAGILSKQIRYSAICLHLHHERSYAKPELIKKNLAIRSYNKKHNIIKIKNGIEKL